MVNIDEVDRIFEDSVKNGIEALSGRLEKINKDGMTEEMMADFGPRILSGGVDPQTEVLVGTKVLTHYLGVKRSALMALIKSGAIPFYRLHKQYRFKLSEVLEALRGRS